GRALAQGPEVMVVPGTVLAGRNRGGHQLIRDGAALVENAEDGLAVLGKAIPPLAAEARVKSGGEAGEPLDAPVLAALDPDDPQDFDQLARRTGLSATPLLARLA